MRQRVNSHFVKYNWLIYSLRVNLDMGKAFYSWSMQRDEEIAGTVVRSTTIPEELGRISYLLSDKTGTLTQNEMVFKKLHLGSVSFGAENFNDVRTFPPKKCLRLFLSISPEKCYEFRIHLYIIYNISVNVYVPRLHTLLPHNPRRSIFRENPVLNFLGITQSY